MRLDNAEETTGVTTTAHTVKMLVYDVVCILMTLAMLEINLSIQ